jgi:hypothetical protein
MSAREDARQTRAWRQQALSVRGHTFEGARAFGPPGRRPIFPRRCLAHVLRRDDQRSPGFGDKLTITGLDASGKVATCVSDFVEGTTTLDMKDATGRLVRTAILGGHADLSAGHIWLWGLPHAYGYRRLRPLVAGLPRSEERITRREHVTSLAINASPKYLFLILFGGSMGLIGSGIVLADGWLQGRSILYHPARLFGKAAAMLTLAHFGHLAMLRKATATR